MNGRMKSMMVRNGLRELQAYDLKVVGYSKMLEDYFAIYELELETCCVLGKKSRR